MNVLVIVKDINFFREFEGKLHALIDFKMELLHAGDLDIARELLRTREISVVFLDIELSIADACMAGFPSCELAWDKPVVLLAGSSTEGAALRRIMMGAQDYMLKEGIEGELVMKAIKYSIERKRFLDRQKDSAQRYELMMEAHAGENGSPIKEEVDLLSLIAKETINGVIIVDAEQRILWVNEGFVRMSGYCLEEVIGRRTGTFLQGKDSDPAVLDHITEQVRKGNVFSCEMVNYSKTGRKYWIHIHGQPIVDESGRVIKYFAIETDITKIRSSEMNYRYLFNNNPMPMWVIDVDSREFKEANKAATKHYGYEKGEFLLMKLDDIVSLRDIEKTRAYLREKKFSPEPTRGMVWQHVTKGGESLFVELTCHPIRYHEIEAYLVVVNDVTEKVKLAEELCAQQVLQHKHVLEAVIQAQEKERLEIGQELHDNVNQILAAAKLYIDVAVRGEPGIDRDGVLERAMQYLTNAIEEIRRLSKSLVISGIKEIGLEQAIRSLIGELGQVNPITFRFVAEGLDKAKLDEKCELNIFRIIQEQLNNIVKHADASAVLVRIGCGVDDLKLSVEDNGRGFDTLANRQGIGIRNITSRTELYNGKVELISSPGRGCKLEIVFPIKKDAPAM